MKTELISVVIEHDGNLCQVIIPQDRKQLVLQLIQSACDDGVLNVVKLSPDWKKVPLSEVNS